MSGLQQCTPFFTHRLVVRVAWCGGCSKWHYRLSLQQPSGPSSRRWSIVEEREADHSPEADEMGFKMFPELEVAARDLQRLYAEVDAGVQRLF